MDISRFINFKNKWNLLVTTVALTMIGLFLQWFGYVIYNSLQQKFEFIKSFSDTTISIAFFLYLVAIYLIAVELFYWVKEKLLKTKDNNYRFRNRDWPGKWLFSGNPEVIRNSELFIKWARAGCLLKEYTWKNFKMTCEIKFLPKEEFDQTVGLVFRAENLDNYFMLELSKKHQNIKPHVRYKGGWDILQPITKSYDYEDYFSVVLEVENDTAYLSINGSLEYTWNLPTHVDVIYRESGTEISPQDKESQDSDVKNKGRKVAEHVQEIPFRITSGMIGFRAHPGQGAIIKGLKIKAV